MDTLFILLIVAAVVYAVVKLVQAQLRRGKRNACEEAGKLGLAVTEVKRDIPFSSGLGHRYRLEEHSCVRYCLAHRAPGGPAWSLLVRPDADSASPFPPGWQLVVHSGVIGEPLRQELLGVTEDWQEEFLELEGSSSSVCAFWEEWGGAEQARRIYGYLQRLSAAMKS